MVGPIIGRLAIDPGDVHVGWALGFGAHQDLGPGPIVGEWTPDESLAQVSRHLEAWCYSNRPGELIIEEFVLYPGRAAQQAGSSFKTSQLIGALKYVAQGWREKGAQLDVVMQGANIKKPTRRQLKARGIKQNAVGEGIHASDAELHYYYRVLRSKEKEKGTA